MTATTPPPLPADLDEGLKRLKMAAMRRLAPKLGKSKFRFAQSLRGDANPWKPRALSALVALR